MAETKKKKVNITNLIVLSMVVGVVAGVVGGPAMAQIQFIGDIFFRLVQMGIVPFVMCTIIVAVGGLTPQSLSGVGLKGIGIFAASSFVAAGIALGLSLVLQPGAGLGETALVQDAVFEGEASVVTFQDTLLSFFGNNIVSSMGAGSMVQCIVFAIALGLAISFWRNTHDGKCLVYDFVVEFGQLLLGIIRGVMKAAPIGIFCYVSAMVGKLGPEVLIPLLKYLVVLGGSVAAFLVLWNIVV